LPSSNSLNSERLWDVVVIGAGIGGGLAARALPAAGHDVLPIDYGNHDISRANDALSGDSEARIAKIGLTLVGRRTQYGHPCGTCVMNDDPSTGVTDRDCRAHGNR
jgi:choline dehydrogenase-like flavoprotein